MKPADIKGYPPLPDWVETFRDTQIDAITEAKHKLAQNHVKVLFIDAPTGAGKTLIAETIRRELNMRAVYVCTTKSLQDQFLKDFPYAKVIKGRGNYPTLDYPERFVLPGGRQLTAGDCHKEKTKLPACQNCVQAPSDEDEWHCPYCHPMADCPYTRVKSAAVSADLTVANTSYFLAETGYVGELGAQSKAGMITHYTHDLVIIDEADSLEDELMRFVEFHLSNRMMKQLRIGPPEKKTVPSAWRDWIVEVKPVLEAEARFLARQDDVESRRKLKAMNQRIAKLDDIKNHIGDDWVYTGYERGDVRFKPVKVHEHAPSALWNHARKFVLMSATIISPEQMAEDLGIPDRSWDVVRVPSSFPVENRPIYVKGVANMTNKTKEESWPKMREAIQEVMDRHPDDRILVHTVSYGLTEFLGERLNSGRVMSYMSAKDRDDVLERFRVTPNAVLLAPSFERGVDLPDDECRVIVVAKIPFPNLADKQVSARLHLKGGSGNRWYAMQTVRALVQMTGRGVRHESDHAETYVLDSQFLRNIWRNSRGMIPQWWRDALIWQV